ncbi:RidA family protein [Streptosporangium sp. NPDC004379]|uniref:RidA family protein n=1 Tax=Streptosporangium sp. NPDC004379 TaxID=3366189 RepID=UPI0036A4AFD7
MIRRWNPDVVAAPAGRYSHLAAVPEGHELVMISGQLGVLPDGALAGPDAESQARQVYVNIELLLESIGATPAHLVKVFTMVAGTEHLPGCRAAMGEAFGRWFPDGDWPAQSLAVVAALAAPEFAVEVEAVAAVPRAAGRG